MRNSRFSGPPIMPIIDEMLIIHPRSPETWGSCANICPRAYLQPRNTDLTFTRIVVSHVSSSVRCSTAGCRASMLIPALFTRLYYRSALMQDIIWSLSETYMSSLPYSLTAACTRYSTWAASPTSV